MIRLLLLIIGYCLGLIQAGFIVGKFFGVDIRQKGSGNSGTTNAMRVLGRKAGITVFIIDLLKCMIPCLIVKAIFKKSDPDYALVYMLWLALGVVLGHNYPFYLHFKGGKGIASTSGYILAFDLRISAICLIAFVAIVKTTKYVSLGSLAVVSLFLLLSVIFGAAGWLSVGAAAMPEFIILVLITTALAFFQHRANIKRLLSGTENKIGKH